MSERKYEYEVPEEYKNSEEYKDAERIIRNALQGDKKVWIIHRNLKYLPPIPEGIIELYCQNNKLTRLPHLPNSLQILSCRNNRLVLLPPLPNTLQELYYSGNPNLDLNTVPRRFGGTMNDNNLAELGEEKKETELSSVPEEYKNTEEYKEAVEIIQNALRGDKIVDLNNKNLQYLPYIPEGIMELHCYNNQLIFLSTLPNSLKELYCSDNRLTSLPSLPNNLQKLSCSDNKLTSLPLLPNSLQELYCRYNQLTSLPSLPNSLKYLDCRYNQLTSLPQLPNNLKYLDCGLNQLTSLPPLPNILEELIFEGNDNLDLNTVPTRFRENEEDNEEIEEEKEPLIELGEEDIAKLQDVNRQKLKQYIDFYNSKYKLPFNINFKKENCTNDTDILGDELSSKSEYLVIINRNNEEKYISYCYEYLEILESIYLGDPIYIWDKNGTYYNINLNKPVFKDPYTGLWFDLNGLNNLIKYNTLVLIPLRKERLGTSLSNWVSRMHGTAEDTHMVYTLKPVNRSTWIGHEKISDKTINNFDPTEEDYNKLFLQQALI